MPVTINGDGSITGLTAGGLPSTALTGTLPNATFPATLPAVSGANLTSISASVTATNMPAGTIVKYQHTTSATRTNISSTQSWTTFSGTQVDFTPTFSNSKLDLTWTFALEAGNNVNGIGFRIYKESPIGGSASLLGESYQHSHWGTGSWTGPGQIVLNWNNSPGVTTPVRYYVQGYRETGNELYINYGQDALGICMKVMEIRQ